MPLVGLASRPEIEYTGCLPEGASLEPDRKNKVIRVLRCGLKPENCGHSFKKEDIIYCRGCGEEQLVAVPDVMIYEHFAPAASPVCGQSSKQA